MEKGAEPYVQEADQYFRQGNFAAAKESLRKAVAEDPADVDLTLALANTCLRLGETEAACAEFRAATLANSRSALAQVSLAACLFMLERYAESELTARRALALEPGNGEALKVVGMSCVKAGRLTEGVHAYAEAVWRNPHDVDALMALSECYAQVGDLDSALLLYQKALETDPGNRFASMRLADLKRPLGVGLGLGNALIPSGASA
jgi:Tfp pilus assembly protein PilF